MLTKTNNQTMALQRIIPIPAGRISVSNNGIHLTNKDKKMPEIVFITSYPPRECGIATYSQDLITALNKKFDQSFKINVCSLESENEIHDYEYDVKYVLNTSIKSDFLTMVKTINESTEICMVMIQHEFGFFKTNEEYFLNLLTAISKPVVIVFHTVLPNPGEDLKTLVKQIANDTSSLIVMTNTSAQILINDYGVDVGKITVIPHGTHLVSHPKKSILKHKYRLSCKKVLSTFGLLSSGKSIETTLDALPAIVAQNPDVMFLIIGKTHPSIVKNEGEKYRQMLEEKVIQLHLEQNVRFINYFLPLSELLEYLQLTDIYLFTSKDPNQAVSGTFSYAMSCGCPIISTPIPHANEVLGKDTGIIFEFGDSTQLANAVNKLLHDEHLRKNISLNSLHRIASTAWENAAIAHAVLFEKIDNSNISLRYNLPEINLDHIKKMTTGFGIMQFSILNQPDIESGYTLDDNARAMIAMCQHYELTKNNTDLQYIAIYLNYIIQCLHKDGYFLNYVDKHEIFTPQNDNTNLADANGRAIWALGYLISMSDFLPITMATDAEETLQIAILHIHNTYSTRAMAFIIKGLYYRNLKIRSDISLFLIKKLANRLVQMYRHEAEPKWQWFESYLTYANSILPEALLCAWLATGAEIYKAIAKSSFDFLLSKIFTKNCIKVISNKNWLKKGEQISKAEIGGEQPIDVAYTILMLDKFHDVYNDKEYKNKMEIAFNWFLGNNHLNRIIYNPCTGGCYDGLEENDVNLNQGAESTISYLIARLTIEKAMRKQLILSPVKKKQLELI